MCQWILIVKNSGLCSREVAWVHTTCFKCPVRCSRTTAISRPLEVNDDKNMNILVGKDRTEFQGSKGSKHIGIYQRPKVHAISRSGASKINGWWFVCENGTCQEGHGSEKNGETGKSLRSEIKRYCRESNTLTMSWWGSTYTLKPYSLHFRNTRMV